MKTRWRKCDHPRTPENTCGVTARMPGGRCRTCWVATIKEWRERNKKRYAAIKAAWRERMRSDPDKYANYLRYLADWHQDHPGYKREREYTKLLKEARAS